MAYWIGWLIGAGVLLILEIFTGTFYLLMIALGFCAGAAVAWMGAGIASQLVAVALVGAVATYALRRSRLGGNQKVQASRDPNALLDIGKTVNVGEWKQGDGGRFFARVMYRGAMWDVEIEPGADPRPGAFTIREVRGSRLIVANAANR